MRLGCASADFRTLGRIWNRAGISRKRKIEVFNACVASRLLYCLATAWLPVAARRRIDGFQARCLRRILHILPSHLSFVSNATVRGIAKERSLSSRLLEQQLQVFGRAAVADSSSTLRRAVFEDRTLLPRPPLGRRPTPRRRRAVGRAPRRLAWQATAAHRRPWPANCNSGARADGRAADLGVAAW